MTIEQLWEPEGLLPSFEPPRLYAAPGARLLYVFVGSWVRAYDLGTLAPRGAPLELGAGVDPTVVMPDPSGDVLVGVAVPTPLSPVLGVRGHAPHLLRLGVRDGGVRKLADADLAQALGVGHAMIGLLQHPQSGTTWAVTALGLRLETSGLGIAELDTGRPVNGGAVVRWHHDLTAECAQPMHKNYHVPNGLVHVNGGLYFGCGTFASGEFVQSPQGGGMMRLSLEGDPGAGPTTPGATSRFPRAGKYGNSHAMADVASGRLLMSSMDSADGGVTVHGFDATVERWVGQFSGGPTGFNLLGIDAVDGRFYGVDRNPDIGMVASEIRATPLTQGRKYPFLSSREDQGPGDGHLAVDGLTGRLFLPYSENYSRITIVRDVTPPYVTPPPLDADALTVDMEEAPGVTASTFSGSAQGYGSRYQWVGGYENLFFNLAQYQLFNKGRDRGVLSAYLHEARLSGDEAKATTIAADRDGLTATQTSPEGTSTWPFRAAHCVDFGGDEQRSEQPNARARCDANGEDVTASAESNGQLDALGVTVGNSSVAVRVRRDRFRGVVTTVTSTASDIRAVGADGGELRIGRVTVVAESAARGRPGTAKGSFTRVVSHVRVGAGEICADVCTSAELARLTSTLAGGRIAVSVPAYDRDALGSKGGAQSLVRRPPSDQLQEVLSNGLPPDRLEVPGLVITAYADSNRTSRLIVQLAGAFTEARYVISALSSSGDDAFGGGALAPLAAIGDGSGGVQGDVLDSSGIPGTSLSPGGSGTTGALGLPRGGLPRLARLSLAGLGHLGRTAPVWALLLIPIYLSARRWLLLQRQSLMSGGRR